MVTLYPIGMWRFLCVLALTLQEAENTPWHDIACGGGLDLQCKMILGWLAESRDVTRGYNSPGAESLWGQGRHFWWKEGIANSLSRMNLKLDLGFGFRFWWRLDLPKVARGPWAPRTILEFAIKTRYVLDSWKTSCCPWIFSGVLENS